MIALAALLPSPPANLASLSFVEAAAEGWYAAPLPSAAAVVSLTTDHDIARAGGLMRPAPFCRAWAATRELRRLRPPPASGLGAIAVFPAQTQ